MKFQILLLGSCLVCGCLGQGAENETTSSPDLMVPQSTTMEEEDQTTTVVTEQPDVSLNISILPFLSLKISSSHMNQSAETSTGPSAEAGPTRWSILSSGATTFAAVDTSTPAGSVSSSSSTSSSGMSSNAMVTNNESSSSTEASSASSSSSESSTTSASSSSSEASTSASSSTSASASSSDSSTSASSSSSDSSQSSTSSSAPSEAPISPASVASLGNSASSVDASSSTSAPAETTSAAPQNGSSSESSSPTSASSPMGDNAASASSSTQAQDASQGSSSTGSSESAAMSSSTPASTAAATSEVMMALADSLYQKCVGPNKSAMCYGDKKNCFRDKNCTFLGVVEDKDSMVNVSILARSFDPASDSLGLTVKFNRHIKEHNDSIKCDPITFKSLQISYRARSKSMMSEMPHYANAVIEKAKLKADCEDGVKNMTLKPKETFGYKLTLSKNDSHALVPQGLVRVSEAPAVRSARQFNPESAPLVPDPAEPVFQKCLADKSHCFVDEASCDLRKTCKTILVIEEQKNNSRFSVFLASKTASVNDVQFAGSLKNGSRSCLESLRNDVHPYFVSSSNQGEPKDDKLQVTNATVYRCDDSTVITNTNNNVTTEVFFKVYGKLLEVAEDPKPINGTVSAAHKRTPLSQWKPIEAPSTPAPTSAGQYLLPTVYTVITIAIASLML